jgi:thiamine biosynthesis lipoprotein
VGLRPDGEAWTVAIEAPEHDRRTPHSILSLQDAAVATSGDYRHWVSVGGHRLSHTMDPRRGAPLSSSPASVTVVAPTCAEADAWATALMVTGIDAGLALASRHSLSALFLAREADGNVLSRGCGPLFAA